MTNLYYWETNSSEIVGYVSSKSCEFTQIYVTEHTFCVTLIFITTYAVNVFIILKFNNVVNFCTSIK